MRPWKQWQKSAPLASLKLTVLLKRFSQWREAVENRQTIKGITWLYPEVERAERSRQQWLSVIFSLTIPASGGITALCGSFVPQWWPGMVKTGVKLAVICRSCWLTYLSLLSKTHSCSYFYWQQMPSVKFGFSWKALSLQSQDWYVAAGIRPREDNLNPLIYVVWLQWRTLKHMGMDTQPQSTAEIKIYIFSERVYRYCSQFPKRSIAHSFICWIIVLIGASSELFEHFLIIDLEVLKCFWQIIVF